MQKCLQQHYFDCIESQHHVNSLSPDKCLIHLTFSALSFLATYGKCYVQVYFTNRSQKTPPNTKVAVSLPMCNVGFGGQKESHTVDTTVLLLYISFLLKIRSHLTSLQFSHPPSPAVRLNTLKMGMGII